MLTIRKSGERGGANHGWLDTKHTFSFDSYYDPKHMGFGPLRVINEDRIVGGEGFPMHGHENMEIITYVISGALEHRDSMGNSTVIKPGEVQRMSAGTGIRHSEFNHFKDKETHLLQIWIRPNRAGYEPSYDQKFFGDRFNDQNFVMVASGRSDKADQIISIHQDADLYVGKSNQAFSLDYSIKSGRKVWVQIVSGGLTVLGQKLSAGDGCAIEDESEIKLSTSDRSEFLFFDLF